GRSDHRRRAARAPGAGRPLRPDLPLHRRDGRGAGRRFPAAWSPRRASHRGARRGPREPAAGRGHLVRRDDGQGPLLRHRERQAPRPMTDLRRLEELGLNSSTPPGQLLYDGWLLRLLPVKPKRWASVTAVYPSTRPLDEKMAHCESVYRARGLPPIFRMTPFSEPPML